MDDTLGIGRPSLIMDTHSPHTITMVDIEKLQVTLVSRHQKIQAIRARIAPLAAEMDRAFQEYQTAIRPLHARYVHLEGELERRQQSERDGQQTRLDEDEEASTDGNDTSETDYKMPKPAQPRSIGQSQEEVYKDQLLEFLVWVLDDPSEQANLDLMSALTEMNQKRSVRLADMLEELPTDLYRVPRGGDEDDLPAWYTRLETWHEALGRRLDSLQKEETSQRSGPKYELWQQYQQGSKVWMVFLDNRRSFFRIRIQRLEARLHEMERWSN